MSEEEIWLIVGEDIKEDEGKGIVRLNKKARERLGVQVGDYVEVIGPYTKVAMVEEAMKEDEEKNIVRISGDLRKKIPVAIGIEVAIRKIKPWALERIQKETFTGYLARVLKEPDRIKN